MEATAIRTVVVLGGYGNFGERIVAALAHESNVRVLIAGRDPIKAARLCETVGGNTQPWTVDCYASQFASQLVSVSAFIVVHTVGPFQGQNYQVARACIAARCHYIDIADSREFVVNVGSLDEDARRADVLAVAGASTLPALSSAVVDRYCSKFSLIEKIDHAVSSGAKPPGLATMQGVMSYVGKPFRQWRNGEWNIVYGWQDVVRFRFPSPLGARWLANCDVPDLDLFVSRYSPSKSVEFRAGVGFATTTLSVWMLSWLVRAGAIKNLSTLSAPLLRMAKVIEPLGDQWSAMYVHIRGLNHRQQTEEKMWMLLAGDNHGPSIPCFPAIALVRKLLRHQVDVRGAKPCMGLLTVDEILTAVPNLNLHVVEPES